MAILAIGELLGIGPDQLSGFVPYSAISGNDNVISSINGSGLSGTDITTVSSIASAYAESAASGKMDNSASSLWYPMTGNPSGFLTSVSFDGYATTEYVDSSLSSKADSSSLTAYQPISAMTGYQSAGDYAFNSAVSSKVDQSAFDDCCSSVNSAISGLSGALSGKQDSSAMSAYALSADVSSVISVVTSSSGSWGVTGDYVEKSATTVLIGSANTDIYLQDAALAQGIRNSVGQTSLAQGQNNAAGQSSLAQGTYNTALSGSLAQGCFNSALLYSFAQGTSNSASSFSIAQGSACLASGSSLAQGHRCTAVELSVSQGIYNYASSQSLAQGSGNTANYASLAQGDGNSAYQESFAQGGNNVASYWSLAQGYGCRADSGSFAQGYKTYTYGSAAAFGSFNGQSSTSDAFMIGDGTAEDARHNLMKVTKDGEIRMYSATSDNTGLPLVATIRALSAWATANGWTGL